MTKIKKILFLVTWIGLLLYLFIVLGVTGQAGDEVPINKINVTIGDSASNTFLETSEVIELISNKHILGEHRGEINTHKLEKKIETHSSIAKAEIYTTITGKMNIGIQQRKPIIRVYDRRGRSYYIDEEGLIMPLSNMQAAHVLVANGHIPVVERKKLGKYNFSKPYEKGSFKILHDLFELISFIKTNEFWNAQIEQIYVNKDKEFEMVPRVGAQIIHFGDINDYQYKLKKLYALYTKGLANGDWNKYEKINLKHSNQVICTKR